MRTKITYYQIQRFLHKWHRRVGLFLAFVFFPVAISGILLNHSDDLNLPQIHITASPLMTVYGIDTSVHIQHFSTRKKSVSLLNQQVFIHDQPTTIHLEQLSGAAHNGLFYILLTAKRLLLLTDTGDIIEKIQDFPQHAARLGLDQNAVFIQSATQVFVSRDGLMTWTPQTQQNTTITWSTANAPSESLQQKLLQNYQGDGLPMERILLDIHSGRILGAWSVYLLDLAGFGVIYLVVTGFFMWLKKRKHR